MTLDELIKKTAADFAALSPKAQKALLRQQAEAAAKATKSWPKAKFHWKNGVKVYESMDDYHND